MAGPTSKKNAHKEKPKLFSDGSNITAAVASTVIFNVTAPLVLGVNAEEAELSKTDQVCSDLVIAANR